MPDALRRVHSYLKCMSGRYAHPKGLGHKVYEHLLEDLNELRKYWMSGDFKRCLEFVHDSCMIVV